MRVNNVCKNESKMNSHMRQRNGTFVANFTHIRMRLSIILIIRNNIKYGLILSGRAYLW